MRRINLFLLAFILVFSQACSSGNYISPEVSLTDVQFQEVTLFETGLKAKVRFENPNEVPLTVQRAKHELILNGVDVGKGFHRESFTIPAYGTRVETIEFRISNLSLATKMQPMLEASSLSYKVISDVKTNRGSFNVQNDGDIEGLR